MKFAISVPDALFEAADAVARQQRKSRSQLYAEAVAAYIGARGASAVREQLDAVYARQPSGLDPALERVQFETLDPNETW
jgi:metal-responsive CopG/Arc/MetJ family transcriptional regulator